MWYGLVYLGERHCGSSNIWLHLLNWLLWWRQLTVVFYRQMVAAVSSSRLLRCSLEAPHRTRTLWPQIHPFEKFETHFNINMFKHHYLSIGVKCDELEVNTNEDANYTFIFSQHRIFTAICNKKK